MIDNEREIRAKAIDEFAEALKLKLSSYYEHFVIDGVAEELKGE